MNDLGGAQNTAKRVFFKTFGCRTNLFDTQSMIASLDGFWERASAEAEANAIVINSCSVTNAADSAARNYARKIRREYPAAKVLFTGCGAANQGAALLKNGEIHGVFSHAEKQKIARFLSSDAPFSVLTPPAAMLNEPAFTTFEGKTRAFIKVQEGCDFSCSYCSIWRARGRARSRAASEILDQIARLADRGFSEFILTGTNTGAYNFDGLNLANLAAKIGNINGVRRVRLGSVEPLQVNSDLIDLLDAPFMEKHLHIALQHTSDIILEKMERRNRYETDLILLEKIANKNCAIGTDFIVGFPSESEDIFNDAFLRLKNLPLTHIHIFKFSPRSGTKAANMKDRVSGDVMKRRDMISALIAEKRKEFYLRNSTPLKILIENNNSGLDQFFSRVKIKCDPEIAGWVEVAKYNFDDLGSLIAKDFYAI
ncbi:MAG: tRNA (N(6)-L-threonylcarbamoyladenosine(37)-C(2))-methylthiotransferase MtaB [Helicobacteraceae bacterium]|nr:tRNA (N(6)-L-threonylcarbamoyladenosine(37)-C(2))-methylthiotransferase MtaB [Helicobacteraceae bacterium]